MAKSKRYLRISALGSIGYVVVVIVLGLFAKDNLITELKHFFSQSTSTILPTEGSIEVAFSPGLGASATIIKAIAQARETILVSAYNFSSKEIAEALLSAKKRNIDVKLILDRSQVSQRYSSSTFFINQGFDVRIDVKHAIFHNKVMIIDDKTVITGSFNFTKAAEERNAENVLIIRNNPPIARLYTENWKFHWQQSVSREEYLKRKIAKN